MYASINQVPSSNPYITVFHNTFANVTEGRSSYYMCRSTVIYARAHAYAIREHRQVIWMAPTLKLNTNLVLVYEIFREVKS